MKSRSTPKRFRGMTLIDRTTAATSGTGRWTYAPESDAWKYGYIGQPGLGEGWSFHMMARRFGPMADEATGALVIM